MKRGAPSAAPASAPLPVLRLGALERRAVEALLGRYGLELRVVAPAEPIPGSYWGESEAGLGPGVLYARLDTPIHSVLHEASHYACMTAERRTGLDRDAGGDDAEEGAVCFLQLVLAPTLAGVGRARLCADMDAWGYSFRLGTARAWFEGDAQDARAWLLSRDLISAADVATGKLRA